MVQSELGTPFHEGGGGGHTQGILRGVGFRCASAQWGRGGGMPRGGGGWRFHLSQNSVYDINRDPVGPAWRRLKAFRCVPIVFVCSVNYPRASLLSLLTEKYLWSCRPLTSHIFCALFCLPPVHM